MKPIYALTLAITGCAADPAVPFVVTDHLAMPADLQIANDLVYSIQYDGSIVTTSIIDHRVRTIVPAIRQVADNEISIDLDAYNIALTADAMFWTEQVLGMPTVHRAGLDGSNPTVLDTGLAPFHALVATTDGACWSSELSISCAHGTAVALLATGLAEPRAMASDGATLYFAQPSSLERLGNDEPQGDGGLYSVALAGGPVHAITIGLDDPHSLELVGTRLVWLDGGSRTCTDNLCTSNHDAALHAFDLAVPAAGASVISDGYASVDAGLAADDGSIYFVAEARLRARDTAGIQHPGGESLMSHATVGCAAFAVADSVLYCADQAQITALELR